MDTIRRGRPRIIENGERTQVYLSRKHREILRRLGGGSVSAGIRIMVESADLDELMLQQIEEFRKVVEAEAKG